MLCVECMINSHFGDIKRAGKNGMTEYVNVRASETLDQTELVAFLKSRFGKAVRRIGRVHVAGTECAEVSVPSESAEFDEIRQFIETKRKQGLDGFCKFSIGWHWRKYSLFELRQAEVLLLRIPSYFEPSGEACGTIYETLCDHCNLGRQVSDLVVDLRRVPQQKDISQTIAWVEWVVSAEFEQTFLENNLRGAEFRGIFDLRKPTKTSKDWRQLWITGQAGKLAEATKLGQDPFKPDEVSWRCPVGHAIVTQFLSEIYLRRDAWDGSDISVTTDLFGQGRSSLRPRPLIIISQRMYSVLHKAGLKGLSYEIAHLV
jgi:hypothetical protein